MSTKPDIGRGITEGEERTFYICKGLRTSVTTIHTPTQYQNISNQNAKSIKEEKYGVVYASSKKSTRVLKIIIGWVGVFEGKYHFSNLCTKILVPDLPPKPSYQDVSKAIVA